MEICNATKEQVVLVLMPPLGRTKRNPTWKNFYTKGTYSVVMAISASIVMRYLQYGVCINAVAGHAIF
jgi:hypothetical protein